ncbi:hypothetical protein MRX60_12890 (plasmid) [Xylella fastidiosa subsp. pauca]|uniref:TrbI/VirB10 family protein n=1 Tax=Xylella fastidiosa TaxID=2371 RepID=UPI00241D0CA0|nr:TrbI/VirB10 family protein [Xylella fastidiosa]MDG5826927.1 hypothetical protein [Xylella fastidiosa subsp. pauca]
MKFAFRKSNRSSEQNSVEEGDRIDGERATASVNKGLGMQTKITNFLIFAAVIVLAVVLLWKYYANVIEQRRTAQQAAHKDTKAQQQTILPPLVPPNLPGTNAAPASAPAANTAPQTGNATPNGQHLGTDGKPILTPEEQRLQRRLTANVKFKLDAPDRQSGNADADTAATGDPGGGSDDRLARSLRTTYTPVPSHRFYLTVISSSRKARSSCSVDPALDSSLPGIVTCTGSSDVWSTNHKVKLMEAGTKYVGEAQQGLSQGQRRMAILWTRAETPNGVIIDLNSGASDELGRPGVSGEIDNHFWDRFGAAIMLSLLNDVGAFMIAREQNNGTGSNNTTIAFPNTVNGTQNIVGDVLKQTIDIPPTLTKNQGANINIYVARDLDFRSVYDLKVKP